MPKHTKKPGSKTTKPKKAKPTPKPKKKGKGY